jgi:hypothetical protein
MTLECSLMQRIAQVVNMFRQHRPEVDQKMKV